MQVDNTIVVASGDKRRHRNDIFRIVVLDGAKVAKLAFACGLVGNDKRGLDVFSLLAFPCGYKINLTCLQLAMVTT